LSGREVGARQT
jgi:hypothetical protein